MAWTREIVSVTTQYPRPKAARGRKVATVLYPIASRARQEALDRSCFTPSAIVSE